MILWGFQESYLPDLFSASVPDWAFTYFKVNFKWQTPWKPRFWNNALVAKCPHSPLYQKGFLPMQPLDYCCLHVLSPLILSGAWTFILCTLSGRKPCLLVDFSIHHSYSPLTFSHTLSYNLSIFLHCSITLEVNWRQIVCLGHLCTHHRSQLHTLKNYVSQITEKMNGPV